MPPSVLLRQGIVRIDPLFRERVKKHYRSSMLAEQMGLMIYLQNCAVRQEAVHHGRARTTTPSGTIADSFAAVRIRQGAMPAS